MQFVVFWNINWLKQRLCQKPLSGREFYIYSFCWLILLSLSFFGTPVIEKDPVTTIFLYLEFAIPVTGLLYAWLCNGGPQGQDFISRFISIGWVVTMRIMVFSLPIFFVLAFAPMEESDLMFETAGTLSGLFIIWRLGHHIEQLRKLQESPKSQ
ncbi:hypothetical protein EOPP23_07635 [Endozoicomonas sp. OPT23]|uniref:hypothetical protein n=1 Tax=Endozoicomonas sp. OPT23 TaxID=2072845 RepID=UPI00129B64F5|nr:hypothetical protein [Endozoicomonas sp. OPT23]MRI32855.1 hypothetical protein [Endozoicomonas sp. OPT23]